MNTVFEITKTAGGKFRFNLRAANQEIILTSQLYSSKRSAQVGIASVKENSAIDSRYERKISSDGKPYFLLYAANNLVIGTSELYSSREAMEKGITAVKRVAPQAETIDAYTTVPA